jgi:hypothetical protein
MKLANNYESKAPVLRHRDYDPSSRMFIEHFLDSILIRQNTPIRVYLIELRCRYEKAAETKLRVVTGGGSNTTLMLSSRNFAVEKKIMLPGYQA